MQYPEDFDFDVTRAINAPVHHHETKATATTKEANPNEGGPTASVEKVPEEVEKAAGKEDAHSIAESSVQIGITRAEELDPVALDKAFKFAAWSSVVLVRFISYVDHPYTDYYITNQLLSFRPWL